MKKLSLFLLLMALLITSSAHTYAQTEKKHFFHLSQESYFVLRGKAIENGVPLCVWVKAIPRKFAGYYHWETDDDAHFGVSGAHLLVGVPYKGNLYCVMLPYSATRADIDNAIKTNLEKWSKTVPIPTSYETFSGADCPT